MVEAVLVTVLAIPLLVPCYPQARHDNKILTYAKQIIEAIILL